MTILEVVTTTIGQLEDWEKRNGYSSMCEDISILKDYLDFHVLQEQYKKPLPVTVGS